MLYDIGYIQRLFANNFIIIAMSKLHKPNYSCQPNYSAVSSSHGKRNSGFAPQVPEWTGNNIADMRFDLKTEIQSPLRINYKNGQRKDVRPIQTANSKNSNRSQAKFGDTANVFTPLRSRAQSKQEPRASGIIQNKVKTEVFLPVRPLTSKGVRNCSRANTSEVKERQASQHDQQIPIHIKTTSKKSRISQSGYARRPSNPLAFQTAIDPEFLSLFAN